MFIFILFVVAAANHADDVVACVILAIVELADVVIGDDYVVDDVAIHDVITGLDVVVAVTVAVVDAKYLGNALWSDDVVSFVCLMFDLKVLF